MTTPDHYMAIKAPTLLCRLFGHRVRPMLTPSFWTPVQHRCTRCLLPAKGATDG